MHATDAIVDQSTMMPQETQLPEGSWKNGAVTNTQAQGLRYQLS